MNPDTVTAGGWALTIACLIITAAIIAGLWREAGRIARAARPVPMSGEVLAHTIRETLHAELTAAQQDDPLEKLWEASP